MTAQDRLRPSLYPATVHERFLADSRMAYQTPCGLSQAYNDGNHEKKAEAIQNAG